MMNFVSVQEEVNPATGENESVVVSLCNESIVHFPYSSWTEYASETEAEEAFLKLVCSGVHATGNHSHAVLAQGNVENPPYKNFVQ